MSHNPDNLSSRLAFRAENFAEKHQRLYLYLLVFFSLAGFAYLLLWPFLAITTSYIVVNLFLADGINQNWISTGLITSLLLLSVSLSVQIFRIKYKKINGLKLTRKSVPELFKVVADVRSYYKRPKIHNIVLTDAFELRIEGTPGHWLPLFMSNTLVIGLPLLQTMTVEGFRCELSRCIGQHSKIIPRQSYFIMRMEKIWDLYNDSLIKNSKYCKTPLHWFFSVYSRLFSSISIPAIRIEELNADSSALDYINELEKEDF